MTANAHFCHVVSKDVNKNINNDDIINNMCFRRSFSYSKDNIFANNQNIMVIFNVFFFYYYFFNHHLPSIIHFRPPTVYLKSCADVRSRIASWPNCRPKIF